MGASPEQTIRSYLDQHGAVEVPGRHLLTTWELETFDPASCERISSALERVGVGTEPPLEVVDGDTTVRVLVREEEPPPPAPPPPAAPPPWLASLPQRGNPPAVAALICGIGALAFSALPVLFLPAAGLGLAAAILGLVARRRAIRNPHIGRETMATVSVALGIAAFAMGIVGLLIR